MKSILAICLIVITAFTLIGCSGDPSAESAPKIDKEKDAAVKKDGSSAPTQAND